MELAADPGRQREEPEIVGEIGSPATVSALDPNA